MFLVSPTFFIKLYNKTSIPFYNFNGKVMFISPQKETQSSIIRVHHIQLILVHIFFLKCQKQYYKFRFNVMQTFVS